MNEKTTTPELSVVILCYRAEDFAPIFVARVEEVLKKRGLNYELILVANYKKGAKHPDRTPNIVRKLAEGNPRLVVVAKEKEGMMGWDMRTGFDVARGKAIAVIDGDGQMSPEDIVTVYDILKEGKYVFVKTYREKRFDGIVRLIISTMYNFLLKLLFSEVKVRDANSKPKVFTREALESLHLTSDDWFIDAEIIIKATAKKLPMCEVPTKFFPNLHRASFIKIPALFEFMKNLLRYRMKQANLSAQFQGELPAKRGIRGWFAGHATALIVGVLLSLLVSAPTLIFPWYAGKGYQGINIPHFGTDSHMYLTRAKDALEGHPLGSPVLREGKSDQDTYFMYNERLLALPLRILESVGVSANIVTAYNVYSLLSVFLLSILLYFLVLRLGGNKLLALTSAVFVIAGYHIVYRQLFFSDFLIYGRPIFPITSSLAFFAYLNALVYWLKTRTTRSLVVAGVLFGALFYVYFFAWTFSLALLGALAVLAIVKRNASMLWELLAISAIGVLLGSYNLWLMWVTLSSGSGAQTSYFHWSYHTHEPILNLLSIAMLSMFVFFAYRKRQDRNLPLIGAFILTFFVVINQQIITGQIVQIGHYHWYFIVPLSIISGLYMLWILLEGRTWRTLVFHVIIAVVFLHAITGQYRSFFVPLPGKMYEQTYRPFLDELNADGEPGVILAAEDYLSYVFTIYTDHDLFWGSPATEALTPFSRFQDALFVYLYLNKNSRNDFSGYLERAMKDPTDQSVYKSLYMYTEGFLSGFDFYKYQAVVNDESVTGEKRKALIASLASEYELLVTDNHKGIDALLSKYGVGYIVVDTNRYPEWDISFIKDATKMVERNGVSLYRRAGAKTP